MVAVFRIYKLLLFAVAVFACSCNINRAYFPTTYEPSLLTKKKDLKASIALATAYSKTQVSYGLTNALALGVNIGYARGVIHGELLCTRYKWLSFGYFEWGGGLGYQVNSINYSGRPDYVSVGPVNSYTTQRLNCSYQSLFLCGSFINGCDDARIRFGPTFKGGPVYIYKYHSEYRKDSYQGKDNPTPLDEENFDFANKFFWMAEPGFFISRKGKRSNFRIQLSLAVHSVAATHSYSFIQKGYPNTVISHAGYHPTIRPGMVTLGWNFFISKPQEKD
jgi:hypothetical protein